MILSVVAVGEKYVNLSSPEIKKFIDKGFSVKILTDNPGSFEFGDTYKYDKKIFTFFDKLLFTGKIVEELKTGVLYIDADRLHEYYPTTYFKYEKQNEFVFFDHWQIQTQKDVWEKWIKFNDFKLDYFNPFINYCGKNNINPNSLFCLWEGIFYFPYLDNIHQILYDIELIKPIFEYMSITDIIANNIYQGKIGISEGLGMSYVLEKNNIKHSMGDIKDLFTPKFL